MGAAAVALCVVAFLGGRRVADVDLTYMNALRTINEASEERLRVLNARLVDADLRNRVHDEVTQRLQNDVKSFRDRIAALEEEVAFYQALMAPSSVKQGLQIAEFQVSAGRGRGEFEFEILLTQVAQQRSWISGDVEMTLQGLSEGGAEQVLSLTDISDADPYPLPYRFRYFQDLSGTMRLPAGFEPRSVTIRAKAQKGRDAAHERIFEWAVQAS